MAKELLADTNESIGEISRRCGMPVPSTFIRQFVAETGKKPGKWRRKIRYSLSQPR